MFEKLIGFLKKKDKANEDDDQNLRAYTASAQTGAAAEVVQRYGSAVKEHFVAYSGTDNETGEQLKKGLKDIAKSRVHPYYEAQNLKEQAGFAAENKYTARENAERIIRGDKSRVHNTDIKGSGSYNELFDHIITDKNGNVIAQEQMKFVGSSPKSALDKLASKKFQKYFDADATITVPSDYYEGILAEADRTINNLQKQLDNAREKGNPELILEKERQIAKYKKIKASIKDSGVSNADAMEARLHPVLSTTKDVAKVAHRAGLEQAKYGAAIGGSVSLVRNLVSVVKGDKSADEAALCIAKDTAVGAVESYATTAIGTALKGAMQNAGNGTVRALARTNIPAVVVTVALESGKTLARFVNGEIDGVQCLEELGEKGVGMTSAAMFAVAGQAAIPIPVVGAMIGSMVGYALASSSYGVLLGSLKNAKLRRAERIRIEKECAEAVALIRQYRAEMEIAVSQYFCDHIAVFTDAFGQMNRAIGLNDIDGFMAGANAITAKVGGNVQFANYAAFDSFMQTDSALRL